MTDALTAAYRERAHLVAHLASLHPSLIAETDDEDWPIIYIETPAGQLSWHVAASDLDLFGHVERVPYGDERGACWDGHDTPEKYGRLAKLTADQAASPAELTEAQRYCGCDCVNCSGCLGYATPEQDGGQAEGGR